MASFWTHIPKSIETVSDSTDVKENFDNITDIKQFQNLEKQRCVCSQVNYMLKHSII